MAVVIVMNAEPEITNVEYIKLKADSYTDTYFKVDEMTYSSYSEKMLRIQKRSRMRRCIANNGNSNRYSKPATKVKLFGAN